ncbi:tetratricopeptide repeat protein [Paratractidigestivibacter sp.]|uniref:tetratricopeptide repeat protein n=1 Tax=Paratractidigestivibacter sp. TaxID=2847316 RepID=UPI002AC91533|nr:tetratricopeptide repeat protein [Paratractidigestivibacter sp.]
MDQQAFESGKAAYQSGDLISAISLLSDAKGADELNGSIDHLIGNAYMKLGRYDSAADAYASALSDSSYGKVGALSCNRGRALLAVGRVPEAIQALTTAVQDQQYSTPYKAYLVLGRAYESAGDVRNAGIAYRSAAIDENNPAPAGALSDLGSCFMRLGRPIDAVEAYRTALDFTAAGESQAKVYSDLGLAYVAANRMPEAVDAFGHAASDPSFSLSPEAQASYDAARKAIAAAAAKQGDAASRSDTDGFLAAAGYGAGMDPLDPMGSSGVLIPSAEDTGFFSVTEEELVQQGKKERKVRRKKKRGGLKVFILLFILVVLVAGAGAFGYMNGYGWPTQESIAESLFKAKTEGSEIGKYIADSAQNQAQAISDTLPSGATVSVDGVDRSKDETTVHLVATLSGGGQQQYTVSMVRDIISWKVTSVSTEFASEDASDAADTTAAIGTTAVSATN